MTKKETWEIAISIIDEDIQIEEEIEKEARESGKWQLGFDSNNALFDDARKETYTKVKQILAQIDE